MRECRVGRWVGRSAQQQKRPTADNGRMDRTVLSMSCLAEVVITKKQTDLFPLFFTSSLSSLFPLHSTPVFFLGRFAWPSSPFPPPPSVSYKQHTPRQRFCLLSFFFFFAFSFFGIPHTFYLLLSPLHSFLTFTMATATTTTTQQVQLQQGKPVQQIPQHQQQKAPIAKARDPFWLGGKETRASSRKEQKKKILYFDSYRSNGAGWLLPRLPPTSPQLGLKRERSCVVGLKGTAGWDNWPCT